MRMFFFDLATREDDGRSGFHSETANRESRDRHRRLTDTYLPLTPRVVFPVPRPRQNKTIPSRSTPLTSVHY